MNLAQGIKFSLIVKILGLRTKELNCKSMTLTQKETIKESSPKKSREKEMMILLVTNSRLKSGNSIILNLPLPMEHIHSQKTPLILKSQAMNKVCSNQILKTATEE